MLDHPFSRTTVFISQLLNATSKLSSSSHTSNMPHIWDSVEGNANHTNNMIEATAASQLDTVPKKTQDNEYVSALDTIDSASTFVPQRY